MTTGFKLSLPTDVPWRRICVSDDMMDPISCDDDRPPRWHSSLAAFRYDPADEYQPYEDKVISYVKVVVTIAPYQDEEVGAAPSPKWLPQEIDLDKLQESHPCYGAVLQVNVAPTQAQMSDFPLSQYPYFIDFEPKKRELYEQVSDTGELLSGSMSNLTVGKSATDTHSTEDYNLDLGGSGGGSLLWGLVQGQGAAQKQEGTVQRWGQEISNVRTTDFSTERREVLSHTTQLSQMYNLFQAFHLGTNRGVFLIEPRPHIQQTEATFINGPRAIEGIQEVFLVVVRPKTMTDFCLSALLETAHITIDELSEPDQSTTSLKLQAKGETETETGESKGSPSKGTHKIAGEGQVDYGPESGWVIDTAHSGGYKFYVNKAVGVTEGPHITISAEHFHADVKTTGDGEYNADITIYKKSTEDKIVTGVSRLFMTARELCCCAPKKKPFSDHPESKATSWVTYEADLRAYKWHAYSGLMTRQAFVESRKLAAAIRNEMTRSFTSVRRQPRGKVRYVDSDTYRQRVVNTMKNTPSLADQFALPLAKVSYLDDTTRGELYRVLGPVTVGDVLTTDAAVLARLLKVDVLKAGQLKDRILGGMEEIGQARRMDMK
jgi:hypothetical protein